MNRIACGLLLCLAFDAQAQNLVPNPSFEEYSSCPDYVAQIDRASGWQQNAGSPDYFNACDTITVAGFTGWVSVPWNFVGYQFAASGQAFAGLVTYLDSTFSGTIGADAQHEYVGTYLTAPLTPGVPVYVSFLTSATYGLGFNDRPRYTCSGVGAKFTTHPLDLFNPDTADNQAAVHLDQVLSDSTGWTLVYGEYTPDSAYQYLLIGNFFDGAHSAPTLVYPDGNEGIAYAYIDNVCVSYDPNEYLHVGVTNLHRGPFASVYPNPFSSICTIRFAEPVCAKTALLIHDSSGRLVRSIPLPPGSTEWSLAGVEFDNGIYTLSIATPIGEARPIQLVRVSP